MAKGAILITGAAKRLGRALALGLGKAGHPIAVHYLTSAREAEAVVEEIRAKGGKAVAVQADLTSEKETSGLIEKTAKGLFLPVSVLINNAAVFLKDGAQSFSEEVFSKNLATNLQAPLILSREFVRALPEETPGNIVNLLDQRVLGTSNGFFSYTLSKHALHEATRLLALELAPGIRVNAIAPGPAFKNQFQSQADFEKEAKCVPLGKGPSPEDFVRAVVFILNTPSLTGQVIALDGGQHLT